MITVHRKPTTDSELMSCCGMPPNEVNPRDRMTSVERDVTSGTAKPVEGARDELRRLIEEKIALPGSALEDLPAYIADRLADQVMELFPLVNRNFQDWGVYRLYAVSDSVVVQADANADVGEPVRP